MLAVVLVTVVLSYFALLFGELVPRRIAMQRPEAAERMTCSVVGVLTVVLHPAVWLLSRSAKLDVYKRQAFTGGKTDTGLYVS